MDISASRLFNYTFQKTTEEVALKTKEKAIKTTQKILERERRIAKLREEYGIDDKVLLQLIGQAQQNRNSPMTYVSSLSVCVNGVEKSVVEERSIGAGVVQNLMAETEALEEDRRNLTRLELITRNLRPAKQPPIYNTGVKFEVADNNLLTLSYEELTFLGF